MFHETIELSLLWEDEDGITHRHSIAHIPIDHPTPDPDPVPDPDPTPDPDPVPDPVQQWDFAELVITASNVSVSVKEH